MRSAVAKVSRRPVSGSTMQKMLAVPQDVLVVGALDPARPHRQAAPGVVVQYHRSLVEADDRLLRIKLAGVKAKDVLHPLDELRGELGHAPHFFPATA